MLIGYACGWRCVRAFIHSPSAHSCWSTSTTDAVAGGISVRNAMGSALSRQLTVAPEDAELVAGARLDAGDEQLPHPGAAQRAHRVRPPAPAVEVAGDAHAARRRGPHREARAADRARRRVVVPDVGAQHVPEPLVAALADQVQVHLAQRGQPAVGVVDDVDPVGVAHGEPVVAGRAGDDAGEQAGVVHLDQRVAVAARADDVHLVGVRAQDAHHHAVRVRMGTEHGVRVVVRAAEQAGHLSGVGRAGVDGVVDRPGGLLLTIHLGTLLPRGPARRAWLQRSGRSSCPRGR